MFLPWAMDEGSVDEAGIITPAAVTPIQTAMNLFRTNLSSGGNPMVLLHEPSAPGTAHPSTPGAPNVVTSMIVDPLISTQRRRLGR